MNAGPHLQKTSLKHLKGSYFSKNSTTPAKSRHVHKKLSKKEPFSSHQVKLYSKTNNKLKKSSKPKKMFKTGRFKLELLEQKKKFNIRAQTTKPVQSATSPNKTKGMRKQLTPIVKKSKHFTKVRAYSINSKPRGLSREIFKRGDFNLGMSSANKSKGKPKRRSFLEGVGRGKPVSDFQRKDLVVEGNRNGRVRQISAAIPKPRKYVMNINVNNTPHKRPHTRSLDFTNGLPYLKNLKNTPQKHTPVKFKLSTTPLKSPVSGVKKHKKNRKVVQSLNLGKDNLKLYAERELEKDNFQHLNDKLHKNAASKPIPQSPKSFLRGLKMQKKGNARVRTTVKKKKKKPFSSVIKNNHHKKLVHFEQIFTVTQPGQMNGIPKINQDSHCAFALNFKGETETGSDKASLIAVFDGHGQDGHSVSKFLASEIQGKLQKLMHKYPVFYPLQAV